MAMAAEILQDTTNVLTEATFQRLVRALGKGTGTMLGHEVLLAMGLRALNSQNDLLAFANRLIARGGAVESVGRALKVSALLRGAVER